ncbi:MAG: RNA methyltransferase [Candidatus Accumulibacter sp.]|jgi:TrmH family RNA methyltransferase|nr:RNA methyltransferase [Accumulibacter sp.]
MKYIVSRDNARFRELKKLCHGGHERRKAGRIVLDGMHLIAAYTERFGPPDEVIVSETGAGRAEIARYLENHPEMAATILADALFAVLATVGTPSGIMAVAAPPQGGQGADPSADTVLLDGIQDPGNLGSILRSAAAAGFRQILLSPDCAQAWSPKTLRAAMGAHFSLDIHQDSDLPAFLSGYRGQALVTAPDATAELFTAELGQPLAWIFGNEGQGVRPEVSKLAGKRIRIPMPGGAESINVGAAAAVCLFETVRRRSGNQRTEDSKHGLG